MTSSGINKRLLVGLAKTKEKWSWEDIYARMQKGDRNALAKAITLVENEKLRYGEPLTLLLSRLPECGNSVRLAVTGPPGAGKSTFIEKLGLRLIKENKKVAVLAIDPSSSISKGSILGDKTRMEFLARHPKAFVRPSPSAMDKGGVRSSTMDTVRICEAAGFDVIIIETVGVGQGEYDVKYLADLFMLILPPAAGDALQGIKKGIVEIADLVIVNKLDGTLMDSAQETLTAYKEALHFTSAEHPYFAEKKIFGVSSLEEVGFEPLITCLLDTWKDEKFLSHKLSNRIHQKSLWLKTQTSEVILKQVLGNASFRANLEAGIDEILNNDGNYYNELLKMINFLNNNLFKK